MTAPAAAIPAPPSTPPAPAATTPRPLTRDDLLRAAAASPWAFLPLALPALARQPGDHELRFLAAASLAKVMLVTPAREQLALLPAPISQAPQVAALLAAIASLPDDRVPLDTLAATLRGNLDALASRPSHPIDLRRHLPAWHAAAAEWDWFRARGGQIVRRHKSTGAWRHLADLHSAIAALTLPHATPEHKGAIKPYILEGSDPPYIIERVLRETAAQADGYHNRVTLIHEDPLELLDGLAQVDLRDHLAAPRVRIIVGPGAGQALASDLIGRIDTQLTGPGLSLSTVRTPCRPSVEHALQLAQRVQLAEQHALHARVDALYAPRDRAFWAKRFRAALDGADRPLRVLVPTCRYSTYIKHASADLVAALTALGAESRLLIEPDDHSHLSGVAYLRAIAEFQPDLVVLINYARANINGALASGDSPAPAPIIHPNIPYVMWVQDSMPHQLDTRVGAAMTSLDFLAGNLREELFLHMGYPRRRALASPIVASEDKFHDRPCEPAHAARHACELAYVSHHSETPEAMHDRKRTEAAGNPALVGLIDQLRPAVFREALAPPQTATPLLFRLRTLAADTLRARGGSADDEALVSRLIHMYALPLADRIIRHQTLEWAADIAASRGWRLHIHGRGWDKHPRLAANARPELEHGDDLRVSYRTARAHLQITAHTVIHQRVVECALSGGLPIGRLTEDDLSGLEFEAAAHAALARLAGAERADFDGGPDVCDRTAHYRGRYRRLGYALTASPRAMAYAALRQRCGLNAEPFVWLNSAHLEGRLARRDADEPLLPEEQSIAWLFGDPAEHLFIDRAGLERLLTRAVEDDHWRSTRIAALQQRIHNRLTHRAFAQRLITFVADRLAAD